MSQEIEIDNYNDAQFLRGLVRVILDNGKMVNDEASAIELLQSTYDQLGKEHPVLNFDQAATCQVILKKMSDHKDHPLASPEGTAIIQRLLKQLQGNRPLS